MRRAGVVRVVRRARVAAAAALCAAAALAVAPPAAHAVQSPQAKLVADRAVDWTPSILDEPKPPTGPAPDVAVRAITQVGDTIVLGGLFLHVQAHGSTTTLTRPYILAFDAATGELRDGFQPQLDGPVDALVAAPDGHSVYVGGEFGTVNGARAKGYTELDLDTGQRVPGFTTLAMNGNVTDLRLTGGRLWVGGGFSRIGGHDQTVMATVDATTGAYDPYDSLTFAGTQNGGNTSLQKFDVTPDGSTMMAIGNFATVDGLDRRQVVMLDLTGPSAAVTSWQTDFYKGVCAGVFDSYLRDLDISPDGSYVVVSTTGAYNGSSSPCDETSRWELDRRGSGQSATWVDYTGGDTTYAVAATGTAVYVGGHFRWQNNATAGDSAGAGAVAREGIAALDPSNGLPLDWNPGRARGVGVFDMLATPLGLWVGSDTDRIGGWEKHPKIAFFPLAGGKSVPATTTPQLPGRVLLAGASPTTSDVLYRVDAGGPSVPALDGGPDWSADDAATSPYRNSGSNSAQYASGVRMDASVPAGTPGSLFDSERWDPADATEMHWAFPVPAGRHVQVRLYLANRCSCTSGTGQRVFDVSVDADKVLDGYDIVGDVGDQVGEMKAFDITSDGTVDVTFGHRVENPLVDAIEIVDEDAAADQTGVDDVASRTFDGRTASGTTTLPDTGIAWSHARGAVVVGDSVYTGWDDGNLYQRSFDGTTFGAPVAVDGMDQLVPLSAFHTDVRSTTAMFYDHGRLYYAIAGQPQLYYRYFTPSTKVVGTVRYTAGNTSGLSFASTSALLLSGGTLYVGDRSSGDLRSVSFAGGVVSGSPTVVSGPGTDGQSWKGHAVFIAPGGPVGPPPNQEPTASFTSTCTDLACSFDGTASSDSDGTVEHYAWTFGDGATSTQATPQHTYTTAGDHDVTLTVTDDDGATDAQTRTVTVTAPANQRPTADFSSLCDALACTFDGTGSHDPDGTVAQYAWTFGDGASSSQASPEHTYAQPGDYQVTLTVTDDDAATGSLERTVTVATAPATPIGFRAAATGTANARKVSVTVPDQVKAGDALVLIASNVKDGVIQTPPAGWTQESETSSDQLHTVVWQRVADASSAGSRVTVALSVRAKANLVLAAYSGTDASAPVASVTDAVETVKRAAHTTPTTTTSVAGGWVLSYWADNTTATTSWTAPAGQSVRATVFGTGGGHVSSLLTDDDTALSSGEVGGLTATASSPNAKAQMLTIVLAPST